jgi:hypothetical protein
LPKDLTVTLEDKPGTLAQLGDALGKAGVNLEGIIGVPSGGQAAIHVLVEDGAKARQALEAAKLRVTGERDVLVLDVPDRPGELAKVARKLADAGVNIDLIYTATRSRIVIGAKDLAKARQAAGVR